MLCSPFKGKKIRKRKGDVKWWYVHIQVCEAFLAAGDTREGQNRAAHEKIRCGHTSIPHFSFRNLLPLGFRARATRGIPRKQKKKAQEYSFEGKIRQNVTDILRVTAVDSIA